MALFMLKNKDNFIDLKTERRARLKVLTQNQKDLRTQVARIKQTIEKVTDEDKYLVERICSLFWEQDITVVSIFFSILMTILTFSLAIIVIFKGRVPAASGLSPTKDEKALKNWLNSLADALKTFWIGCWRITCYRSWFCICYFKFPIKVVGFFNILGLWLLFIAGVIGVWLMQKSKKLEIGQ